MISILDVAKVFLSFGPMTHKKLQKLCYYAQAWHLAINDEPLAKDAVFQAWVHGPVCPQLYQRYKAYGADTIYEKITELPQNIENNSYLKMFIGSIYKMYSHLSGSQLESLTHTEDPWVNARNRAKAFYWQPSDEKILEEDMKSYYRKILNCK